MTDKKSESTGATKAASPARKPAQATNPAFKPKAPPAKAKEVTAEDIKEAYDFLIDKVAQYESQRRNDGRHVNYFSRHRRQVEHMQRNFLDFVGIRHGTLRKYS